MVKIVMCDDNLIELNKVKAFLTDYNLHVLPIDFKSFSSSKDLFEDKQTLAFTDIFLLDIVMPDFTGIELGKVIRSINEDAVIIYLTTSTDFALDAYGVSALHYLLKPVSKNALFDALKKGILLVDKKERYFSIQTRTELIPVKVNDIQVVEYRDHVLYFSVADKIIKSKSFRTSFEEAIKELFDHESFVLTHRSYLINMNHVHKMNTDSLLMANKAFVPISKNRVSDVRKTYMNYFLRG